jgi:ABC-type Na+ efflux pump permease subunit
VGFGVVLSIFAAFLLEVLEAMMGRLVTRPDTLSQDLQVFFVLVALVFLRLSLAPAGHE